MIKAFFLDELPWHAGYGIISNHFDEIDMPQLYTSYQYLQAFLVNMNYEEYLDFCKNYLGAKIYRKNGARYASVHFPITQDVKRFVDLFTDKFEKGYNCEG